ACRRRPGDPVRALPPVPRRRRAPLPRLPVRRTRDDRRCAAGADALAGTAPSSAPGLAFGRRGGAPRAARRRGARARARSRRAGRERRRLRLRPARSAARAGATGCRCRRRRRNRPSRAPRRSRARARRDECAADPACRDGGAADSAPPRPRRRLRGGRRRRGSRDGARHAAAGRAARARRHPERRPNLVRRVGRAAQGIDDHPLPADARAPPRARDRPRGAARRRARLARQRAVPALARRRGVRGASRTARSEGRRRTVSGRRYTVGVDFGTESGRAVLVDCADGRELATTVYPYANGVIDERLPEPNAHVELEPDWALQDPADYLRTLEHVVPAVLAEARVDPGDVIGIGIDFTACTMLPTSSDGTPLCLLDDLRSQPHAWVKLWKHHAAQSEADRINEVAAERSEPWLPRYGGKISSEWFFAKTLQILDEAPAVYARAD